MNAAPETNVLMITWNYPPRRGGMENLLSSVSAGLRRHHRVIVVTAHAETASKENNVFRSPIAGLGGFALYATCRAIFELLRNPKISILFGGSALVAPLVVLLAWLFRRKAVVQVHGLDVVYPSRAYQWVCAAWLKSCDRIVANSSFTAALAERVGVNRNMITIISPGVDAERFAPFLEPQSAKACPLLGKKLILFVGRLTERKGVKEFIDLSLPQIISRVPDAYFVIVGNNAVDSLAHRKDSLGEIRAAIVRQKLQDSVHWLGSVDDERLRMLYQACDLVILPALLKDEDPEGFGMVLLEAAAAGKPAVTTRVGGISEAVADGHSGIVVEPGDYDGLANAVIMLLTEEKTRQRMGQAACRRAQEFSWERITQRYTSLFASLLDGPQLRHGKSPNEIRKEASI